MMRATLKAALMHQRIYAQSLCYNSVIGIAYPVAGKVKISIILMQL